LTLGEHQRGYRILAGFAPTERVDDVGALLPSGYQSLLANELALFAARLGRLAEAWAIRQVDDNRRRSHPDQGITEPSHLGNSSYIARTLGLLAVARELANQGVSGDSQFPKGLVYRAIAAHDLGDIAAARVDFACTTELEDSAFAVIRVAYYARHYLDLGDLPAARGLADSGLETSRRYHSSANSARFHALLARVDLEEGGEVTPHLDEIQAWSVRTGEMAYIIEAYLLAARHLLARGDTQAALGEAETGLLHAVTCGYGLLRIELLVALARIRLAWPDPPKAIKSAREALDLATHANCQYAWGEADAAQVWGEAYFANHEPELAQRAFTQALAVRKRIEHPGVGETKKWLAMVGV
jgi:tetratricopeptide (TPR) repeat protein